MALALESGVSLPDFWEAEFWEVAVSIRAYKQRFDAHKKLSWDQSRWLACWIVNCHTKKTISPQSMITFPWESGKAGGLTLEEQEKRLEENEDMWKKWDEEMKNRGKK